MDHYEAVERLVFAMVCGFGLSPCFVHKLPMNEWNE